MAAKATTFRLDEQLQAGLELLSRVQGCTQNQLVNEAVRELLSRRTREAIVDIEATLARLKAYRLTDPTGEKSMSEAMDAEAAVEYDPAEGVRVEKLVAGPASARMLEQLSGRLGRK